MSQQRRNPFGAHGQLGGMTGGRGSPAGTPGRASPAYAGYAGYYSPGLMRGASPSPSEGSSSGSGIMLTIRELAGKSSQNTGYIVLFATVSRCVSDQPNVIE